MTGSFTIIPTPISELDHLSKTSIAFEVRTIFEVQEIEGGLGGLRLVEKEVAEPYIKDYDAEDGDPVRWRKWDLTNWEILFAYDGDMRIGSATMAWRSPGMYMLQERDDLALLWDLRINHAYRGQGVGRALYNAGVAWARERGCVALKIETQNTNVPACRFYAAMGADLWSIDRFAYSKAPHEALLLWRVGLTVDS